MFEKILLQLEDPEQPLLGPNVKALKFWGILLPDNLLKRYLYIFLHATIFLFTLTEYVDIWYINTDMIVLLTNVKITLVATVSCCKISTFLAWQRKWKDIIEYVTKADLQARISGSETDLQIIKSYTRYSRTMTYLYWSLVTTTNLFVIVQPIYKYFSSSTYRINVRNGTEPLAQVVNSWVPFEKTTSAGFIGASLYQIFAATYGGGWITSFDTNAMVIMVFFKGELELIKINASNIFDVLNHDEVMTKIKTCHKRHIELIKYVTLYNSCLSPVMFVYMIVCSIMLCASVFQTTMETSPMNQLLIAEYLVFGVSQLFLYCWHGNDVTYTSQDVSRGAYESGWWKQNMCRRELMLLSYQLDRQIIFTAGPFLTLNIATFINILKGSYSYYTLLK